MAESAFDELNELVRRLTTDLERAEKAVHFWESNCKAQGRDLKKALDRLKELGEIPVP